MEVNYPAGLTGTSQVNVTGTDGTTYTGTLTDTAPFQFTGTQPSDFTATVDLGDGNTLAAGSQGIIGPDGSTGQIVVDANGGDFTVQINDPAATPGQTFPVTVAGSDGFAMTGTLTGNATVHFTDPNAATATQPVTYTALVTLPDGKEIQVGSNGVIGADQATAQIVAASNGGYQVVIDDPTAALGQTFNVTVTGTDGTNLSNTVVNDGEVQFIPTDNNANPSDFTAVVTIDGQTVTLNSQGVVSGPTNLISGDIIDPPAVFAVMITPAANNANNNANAVVGNNSGSTVGEADFPFPVNANTPVMRLHRDGQCGQHTCPGRRPGRSSDRTVPPARSWPTPTVVSMCRSTRPAAEQCRGSPVCLSLPGNQR